MIECDVLVIGAGPAGSSAALAAAKRGLKTIFIDKKSEIGVPVQCAETISKFLVPMLPFKVPPNFIKCETEGVSFCYDGLTVERKGYDWSAFGIDRETFDKWLAEKAIAEGAKLSKKTELLSLDVKDDFKVVKAVIRKDNAKKEIIPKVVIAADGVESSVLDNLGVEVKREGTLGKILSYEVKNVDSSKPNMDQLFLGDFAPGAAAYIFPKSKTSANIGVATLMSEKKLKENYQDFLNVPEVKKQLKNSTVVKEKSGKAPFRYTTYDWVYGNVLLVGDAAGQILKPFGEGYIPAIVCGSIVGELSHDYIKFNKPLESYKKRVKDKFGNLFSTSDKLAEIMYRIRNPSNKKYNLLRLGLFANVFKIDEIESLIKEDEEEIKNILIGRSPP